MYILFCKLNTYQIHVAFYICSLQQRLEEHITKNSPLLSRDAQYLKSVSMQQSLLTLFEILYSNICDNAAVLHCIACYLDNKSVCIEVPSPCHCSLQLLLSIHTCIVHSDVGFSVSAVQDQAAASLSHHPDGSILLQGEGGCQRQDFESKLNFSLSLFSTRKNI